MTKKQKTFKITKKLIEEAGVVTRCAKINH